MHTARLQYDRIIITGASSGFGEAFAGTLAPHTAELPIPRRGQMLYLCREGACAPPVGSREELERLLRETREPVLQ